MEHELEQLAARCEGHPYSGPGRSVGSCGQMRAGNDSTVPGRTDRKTSRFWPCQWLATCCIRKVVSSKKPGKGMRVRWFLASVFAALWLFTGFAATSAELHHCLHEDAPASEHQCLFTKYADGQFLSAPEAQLTFRIPLSTLIKAEAPSVVELPSVVCLLPPERGPPVL